MDTQIISLTKSVIDAATGAKLSINKLCGINWSSRSEFSTLNELYLLLPDVEQIREALQMNDGGFLSRHIKDQSQLLEKCRLLLQASRTVCNWLYDALSVALQSSSNWGGMGHNQFDNAEVANVVAQLRIYTMSLEVLVTVMQFEPDKTDNYKARRVEKAINEVRNFERVVVSKFKSDGLKMTLGMSEALSQRVELCNILAGALEEKQTRS